MAVSEDLQQATCDAAAELEKKGIGFEAPAFAAVGFGGNGSKWVTFRNPDGEYLELTEIL